MQLSESRSEAPRTPSKAQERQPSEHSEQQPGQRLQSKEQCLQPKEQPQEDPQLQIQDMSNCLCVCVGALESDGARRDMGCNFGRDGRALARALC